MKRILLACIPLLVAAACSRDKAPDVMDSDNGPQPIAKTTQCTVPNSDGVRCDVKTCKADAQSDCAVFQDRCTQSGHSYTGDKNQGTCTRGASIGRARPDSGERLRTASAATGIVSALVTTVMLTPSTS